MENPQDEIAAIIPLLVATESPDTQKEAVLKYFDEDASFIHPLCRVDSGPNSRNDILAIYQFYRFLSPKVEVDVYDVAFTSDPPAVVVNVSQLFHLRFSPFKPVPCNLKSYIKLKRRNNLYYISSQEDFYHPEDLCKLVCPPVASLINWGLAAGRRATVTGNQLTQYLGFWRPTGRKTDEKHIGNQKLSEEDAESNNEKEGGEWHTVESRSARKKERKRRREKELNGQSHEGEVSSGP